MKKVFIIISLLIITTAQGQTKFTKHINSYELDENREIQVYLPPSYEQDSTRHYPLTIVFDAEYLFDVVVGNSVLFAQKDKAPEQIIIGINQGSNRRYRDCSFDKLSSYPSGKSESFYRFVRGELLNFIEDNYRISPFKTIVGNTLTGNFTNYFLIENEPSFNAFISINPNLPEDMAPLLEASAGKLKNNSYYYYLSNGDHNSEKKRTAIANIDAVLANRKNKSFQYKYDNFNGTTPTASIGQSIPNALSFIFKIYSSISKKELDNDISILSPPDAIAYLENKYVEIEYLFGTDLKIRERDIYAIESIIIDKEKGEYLRDFGEMIYKLFPESPLGDYYIGLDFELRGKYKRALEAYKEGYMKFEGKPTEAENFYQNIERVANKVN